jgi:hypothetical protein
MRLSEAQSRELLQKHGVYVTEVCDKCGKILATFDSLASAKKASGARGNVAMGMRRLPSRKAEGRASTRPSSSGRQRTPGISGITDNGKRSGM